MKYFKASKKESFLKSMPSLFSAAILLSLTSSYAPAQSLVSGTRLVNGVTQDFEGVTQVGGNVAGFFLEGGIFAVSNTTFTGFNTSGGDGSGGGAGLGGVFFVNDGVSLTLNNVSLIGNTVSGGDGGGGQLSSADTLSISNTSALGQITNTVATAVNLDLNTFNTMGNTVTFTNPTNGLRVGQIVEGQGFNEGVVISSVSEDRTVVTFANTNAGETEIFSGGITAFETPDQTVTFVEFFGTKRLDSPLEDNEVFVTADNLTESGLTLAEVQAGIGASGPAGLMTSGDLGLGGSIRSIRAAEVERVTVVPVEGSTSGETMEVSELEAGFVLTLSANREEGVTSGDIFIDPIRSFEANSFTGEVSGNGFIINSIDSPSAINITAGQIVTSDSFPQPNDDDARGTRVVSVVSDGNGGSIITLSRSPFGGATASVNNLETSDIFGRSGDTSLTFDALPANFEDGFRISSNSEAVPAGTIAVRDGTSNRILLQDINGNPVALTGDIASIVQLSPIVSANVSGNTLTLTAADGFDTSEFEVNGRFSSGSLVGEVTSVVGGVITVRLDSVPAGSVTVNTFDVIPDSVIGGSLNDLFTGVEPIIAGNGSNASSASISLSGGTGEDGGNGGDAAALAPDTQGPGGLGGNGGAGSDGEAFSTTLVTGLASAVAGVVTSSVGFAASFEPQIGVGALGPVFVSPSFGGIATAALDLAGSVVDVVTATGELIAFEIDVASGTIAGGGGGGDGGSGGDGSFGFGGGSGGVGGSGGQADTSVADPGAGGDGGVGGMGGFGAGGGNGGAGGDGGTNGSGNSGSNAGAFGGSGTGGVGGFGGGVGANGEGQFSGGGSGFGGALFVRDGGTVNITGNALFSSNIALAGSSTAANGVAGDAAGNGIFIQRGATLNFNPGEGFVQTINDTIADDSSASLAGAGIAAGSGAQVNIASGLVIFNSDNTFSGNTNILGGILRADDGEGIHEMSNINFAGGGQLETSGLFERSTGEAGGRIQFTGSGGFSAFGGELIVTLNGDQNLVFNEGNFVQDNQALLFGTENSANSVNLTNDLDLNGGSRQISVHTGASTDSFALISGAIIDTGATAGSLNINNVSGFTGTLVLGGVNTFTGDTNIFAGTLRLAEGASLSSLSTINISDGAIFDLALSGDQTVGDLTGGGTIQLGDENTLTIDGDGVSTFGGVISDGEGGANVVKIGSGTQTFTEEQDFTGSTTVSSGTLALAGDGSIAGSSAVTVAMDAILDVSQTTEEREEEINNLSGAGFVSLGNRTLELNQSEELTFSGVIQDGGIGLGAGGQIAKSGTGNLTLTGANIFTGLADVREGTLTLAGDGSLATNNVQVKSEVNLTVDNGGDNGLAEGATLENNGTVNLNASDEIAILNNTGTVNGVIVDGESTTTLTATTSNLNVGSVINANLAGTTLNSNGAVALNGTSTNDDTNVITGILTLGSAERLNDTTRLNIADGAVTILGGNEQIGSLNDIGDQGGELNTNGNRLSVNSGEFSGEIIDGAGNAGQLTVNGAEADVLTLTGANTFTGEVNVDSGSLILDGNGSLATNSVEIDSGASLTITETNGGDNGLAVDASLTNSGTVNLNADDAVTTLTNTGTVNGVIVDGESTTTLTATTSNLNEGSEINANLAGTTLNSNGAVALNGTSTNDDTNVQTGTLTLGSAERLNDTTRLNIADGAVTILGGNEQIGSLNDIGEQGGELNANGNILSVNSGEFSGEIIDGAGNAGQLTVNGAEADVLTLTGANTFTGEVNVDSGSLILDGNGSLATNSVEIDSGASLTITETNGGDNGLAVDASLTNSGTVNLNADDAVTTLTNTGTVNGVIVEGESTTTLTATTSNLNEGSEINANLAGTTLNSNGAVTLNGTSDNDDTDVQTGTLTLGSAERLNDATRLDITSGATLALGGDEAVGSITGDGTINFNAHDLSLTNAESSDFGGAFENSADSALFIDRGTVTINPAAGNEFLVLDQIDLNNNATLTIAGNALLNAGNGEATQDGLPANGINVSALATLALTGDAQIIANNIHVDGEFAVFNSGNLNFGVIDGSGNILSTSFNNRSSSTISGNLSFSGDVINNGTISPGNSPGIINIAGDLVSNGVLELEVNDPSLEAGVGFDQVRVGGEITLGDNSILQIVNGSGTPQQGEIANVLSDATGAPVEINGAFGSVEFDQDTLAVASAEPTENAAVIFDLNTGEAIFTGLNAAGSEFSDISSDSNVGRAFAGFLSASEDDFGRAQIDSGEDIGAIILNALLSGDIEESFRGLVPDIYVAASEYAFEGARQRDQNLLTIFNTYQEYNTWSLFTDANFGSFDVVSGDNANANRNSYSFGSSYYTANNVKVGFIGSYNDGDIDSSRDGSIDVDGSGITGFIAHQKDDTTAYFSIGYESNNLDYSRNTQEGVVTAETDSDLFSITAGVEHMIYRNENFSIQGNFALSYDNYSADGFLERGAIDALNHGDSEHDLFSGTFGLKTSYVTRLANRNLRLSANVGATFVLTDESDEVDISLINDADVRFGFRARDQTSIRGDFGINAQYELIENQWLGFGYSAGFGEEMRQNFNVNYIINF